jgi:protein-tyrosine phosphatase
MTYHDLTPVITQPERNPILRQRMEDLERWIRAGCLLQVTALSFLDRFGKAARVVAETLMERNMVHFVASDAHGTEDRNPLLAEAYAYVADRWGEPRAKAVFSDNPRATLTGTYLEVEEPLPERKKRWFW